MISGQRGFVVNMMNSMTAPRALRKAKQSEILAADQAGEWMNVDGNRT
jgi:hypothetical protein